jgi:hypothetical protein
MGVGAEAGRNAAGSGAAVKLRAYTTYEDGKPTNIIAGYHHWCPACDEPHGIATATRNRCGAIWSFNGDLEKPTFAPSIRCFTTDAKGVQHTLCHYFIKNGMIEFCGDNPHAFNNKTVPLPDYPESD